MFEREPHITPFLVKLLRFIALAAGIALLAALYWNARRGDRSGGVANAVLADAEPNQPSGNSILPARAARPVHDVVLARSAGPMRDTDNSPRTTLHERLRLLLETKTADEDGARQQLAELTAMLTHANAGEIARDLSPDELHSAFGPVVLERWLSADPIAAAKWISAQPDANDDQAWLVAKKLINEPGRLEAFSSELPEGNFRQQLLFGAGMSVLDTDPTHAIAFASRMTPSAEQTNLLETIAFSWATREPSKALDWMTTLPDESVRERLVGAGAKAIAVTDPDLAVQWLSLAVKTESLRNETALSVVESWAAKNPAQAAAWLIRFPDTQVREAGADVIARRWVQTDPQAAAAWLADLPEGEKILIKWQAEQAKPSAEE